MTTRDPDGGSASAFDEARDLLQAALDDARADTDTKPATSRPEPSTPSKAPAKAKAPVPPKAPVPAKGKAKAPAKNRAPAPAKNQAPAPTAAAAKSEAPTAAAGAAAAGGGTEAFWEEPAPRSAAARAGRPKNRRRRRAAADAAAASAIAGVAAGGPATHDDFDDTDALYQAPERTNRRRRRPAAEGAPAAAVAGAATTAATGPFPSTDLAPELRAPVEPEETEVTTEAPPAETEATTEAPTEAPTEVTTEAPTEVTTEAPIEVTTEVPAASAAAPAADVEAADRRRTPAPVVPIEAVRPATDVEPERAGANRRVWAIVAAAALVVVVVGALLVAITGGGSSKDTALRAGGKVELTFPSETTAEGAQVTRQWALEGKQGREFVGSLSMTNPTNAALATSFTETIPKALAANASDVTFDPQPVIVKADPVVRYDVTIPAGGTFVATYKIAVAPDGVSKSRLETWARDLGPTTTTTTTTAPAATTEPTTPETTPATTPKNPGTTARPTVPPTEPPTVPPTEPPPPARGMIVIEAFSSVGEGTFTYDTPGGGLSLPAGGSSLVAVDPGTYTLTQTSMPADQILNAIECGSRSGSSTTVTVNSGETVYCRFVNVHR